MYYAVIAPIMIYRIAKIPIDANYVTVNLASYLLKKLRIIDKMHYSDLYLKRLGIVVVA